MATSPSLGLRKLSHEHHSPQCLFSALTQGGSRVQVGVAPAVKCSVSFSSARAGTAFPAALMSLITSLVGVTLQPPMMSSLF